MTKKIWVSISSSNQGYIERCDSCGVTQPDSSTAFRQLHYDDCPVAPPPGDLVERLEELYRPRSEEVETDIEQERVRRAQEVRMQRELEIQTAKRAELDQKIREGKVIPITQRSDPQWKIKEQIAFIESAIKGRNLQFLLMQIDWSKELIASTENSTKNELVDILQNNIKIATQIVKELSLES